MKFPMIQHFPDYGRGVILEFRDGRQERAYLVQTAQGDRWRAWNSGNRSWSQFDPNIVSWEEIE